jgi:hypothetical protein
MEEGKKINQGGVECRNGSNPQNGPDGMLK